MIDSGARQPVRYAAYIRFTAPRGQQIMIPTPGQPTKRYGLGAVDYHSGETVVLFRTRKRRREVAELLEPLMHKHPTGMVYGVCCLG